MSASITFSLQYILGKMAACEEKKKKREQAYSLAQISNQENVNFAIVWGFFVEIIML